VASPGGVAVWRLTGDISNKTAALVRSLLPARKIYVLAAPGDIGGAYLFGNGLSNMAADLDNDQTVQIVPLFVTLNSQEGDQMDGTQINNRDYRLTIRHRPTPDSTGPFVVTYDPRVLATYSFQMPIVSLNDPHPLTDVRFVGRIGTSRLARGTVIQIPDFQPGKDHVIVVSASGAQCLDE